MSRREAAALTAVALLVRMLGWFALDYELTGDARSYQLLATNLAEHRVLSLSVTEPYIPTTLRPPLYPALVAAIQAVTRTELLGLQLVQLMFSAMAALMLALAVRRTVRGPAGAVAAWAVVLNPFDGSFVAAMLTETLSTFLVSGMVTSLALLRGARRFIVAGIFAGLAGLTRDLFLVLPLALACLLALREVFRASRRRWRPAALVVMGAAVVILPWTVRNVFQFGRLIPIASGGLEYSLWIGSWETSPDWVAAGIIKYPPEAFPTPAHQTRLEAMNGELYDEQARALLKEMAVANWKKAPVAAALRCLKRAPQTWLGTRSEIFKYRVPGLRERGSLTWKVMKASQWGLNASFMGLGLVFFIGGRRLGRRTQWLRCLAVAPVLVTVVSYLPMHSVESRYSQPVLQLFILGAGLVSAKVLKKARSRWLTSRPRHLQASSQG